MRKFAVISGFLGAGKTTAMMALTKRSGGRTAMISNDLGEGVDLADDRLARLSGCAASQIEGECICFCHDRLRERLEACYTAGCELVVSDIPGFGVGALEHVYRGLAAESPDFCELAPFTVLIEPHKVELLRSEGGAMRAIVDAQLLEADLIVLNKIDTISPTLAEEQRRFLAARYPEAAVIAVSARTGEGMDALASALREGSASLRLPEIDDEEGLEREMDALSEYYYQYRALVCCFDFDGSAYLADLASRVRGDFRDRGLVIPHLKALAWGPEGDFGKVDLIGTDREIELTRPFERPCTELAVILNASASCPAEELDTLITTAAREISAAYGLELTDYKKECFCLGD